jgi:ABC-type transport system involved in cytochrome bd biosynthesis fused ATPase/permease subunit
VTTRWPGAEPVCLNDIHMPAGRRLAILGDDRAGMSTRAAVLLRILDYRGSITLGGWELRELTGDAVRRSVGHCGRYAPVVDGTVADNVRIARPGASDGEVKAVLRRTGLEHWADVPAAPPGPPVLRIAPARALLADVPALPGADPVLRHVDAVIGDTVCGSALAAQ